jgi:hypothetical protein
MRYADRAARQVGCSRGMGRAGSLLGPLQVPQRRSLNEPLLRYGSEMIPPTARSAGRFFASGKASTHELWRKASRARRRVDGETLVQIAERIRKAIAAEIIDVNRRLISVKQGHMRSVTPLGKRIGQAACPAVSLSRLSH